MQNNLCLIEAEFNLPPLKNAYDAEQLEYAREVRAKSLKREKREVQELAKMLEMTSHDYFKESIYLGSIKEVLKNDDAQFWLDIKVSDKQNLETLGIEILKQRIGI